MMECLYITSAIDPKQFPAPDLPEIAFVGRSNVGKSSLLNALAKQKGLARTSKTPGRTQMINFFQVPKRGYLVDLPGYGYSSDGIKLRDKWQNLMDAYFKRPSISLIAFLVDSRRVLNEEDQELLTWLGQRHQILLVMTKSDKLNRKERDQAEAAILRLARDEKIPVSGIKFVSTLKNDGIAGLRGEVMELLNGERIKL